MAAVFNAKPIAAGANPQVDPNSVNPGAPQRQRLAQSIMSTPNQEGGGGVTGGMGGYSGPTFTAGQTLTADQLPDFQRFMDAGGFAAQQAGTLGGASNPASPANPGMTSNPASPVGQNGYSSSIVTGANDVAERLPGINQTTVDYSGLPDLQTGLDSSRLSAVDGDFSNSGSRVRDAMFRRTSGLLNPEHERARSSAASRLANQGIVEGSERWNEEMGRLDQQRDLSLERSALDADISAGSEEGRLFQQALALRRQGVDEQGINATMGLNARGMLTGERERGADRTFNQSYQTRGQLAGELAGREGRAIQREGLANQASANASSVGAQIEGARLNAELGRRRLGLDEDSQGFNQWLAAAQFARNGVNMPNYGSPIPMDVTGAASVANQNANQQAANNNARTQGYFGLAGSILGPMLNGKRGR